MTTKKEMGIEPLIGALAALALLSQATEAAVVAGDVGITTHDVSATAGGSAVVPFELNFGSGIQVGSFDLYLNFDPALLQIDLPNSNLTYQGNAASISQAAAALPDAANYFDLANASGYSAHWFTGGGALAASGSATLHFAFLLQPGFDAGMQTSVEFVFDYSDAGDPVTSYGPFSPNPQATVSAVPLPAAWVLALGASGLLFGTAQKRPARRRLSPIA